MPRVTAEAQQAANVAAYRAVWSMFWGNVTALSVGSRPVKWLPALLIPC